MKIRKIVQISLMALVGMFLLSSCAAGNETFDLEPAGFFMGLWHGVISLVTFVISLFNENVNIYEINNTGWPYNLGFILGIAIFYGGSSKGSCRR
jgi:succinate-acetate transporter protein